MIISLRGTNGAGKSTIVKKIMKQYPTVRALMLPYRRKPAGYICEMGTARLFVPGHYEIDNGGIDTIGDLKTVYNLISSFHELGCNILYEGMNLSDSVAILIMMHLSKIDVRVIFLDHPLSSCISSVRARGHKIREQTIVNIYKKCDNQFQRLQREGIRCIKLKRKAALNQIEQWLEIKDDHSSRTQRLSDIAADNSISY